MTKIKTHVISMCYPGHLDVWKLTSRLLPVCVPADLYSVFVPEDNVSDFREATDPQFEVRSVNELDCGFAVPLHKNIVKVGNEKRYQWYLQQFHKLQAIRQSTADRRVIWDADCVPINPIELFDKSGRPLYMDGDEFHNHYFTLVDRWLGLGRVQSQSFVIPGFPLLGVWVDEFFEYVESRHGGKPWHDSLLESIDFSLVSGFSETETLGTWVANRYPGQWQAVSYEWERFGQSRFGPASRLSPERAREIGKRHRLDIVSFENWDRRNLSSLLRNTNLRLRKRLKDLAGPHPAQ